METVCPECGAALSEQQTCQDHFHQMLAWEWEHPDYWEVHHLTVLCYHLQHPSLYSPEGLSAAKQLVADFLERGTTPEEVRRQRRASVDSHGRTWKIQGTPASHGGYDAPIQWTMTTANVIAAGAEHYVESVRAWAQSVHESLKNSGTKLH